MGPFTKRYYRSKIRTSRRVVVAMLLLALGASLCEGRKSNSLVAASVQLQRNKKRRSLQQTGATTGLPKVQALLVPRRINLRKVLQSVCFAALFVSLGACVATSGQPYYSAVFQLVHSNSQIPTNYQPSRTERFLANKLAAASHDILPPLFLPSALPLISLLGSMAIWTTLCILLPQWILEWNIFLKYNTFQLDEVPTIGTKPTAAVLVTIPRQSRITESNGKSKLVLPLLRSDDDNIAPYYFDLNHRRLYTNLQRVTDGGPPPFNELPSHGFTTRQELQMAQRRYGPYNSLSLPEPTMKHALQSRLTSPLSVLQLLGKILQALEESPVSSIFSIATTVGQHWFHARQAIVSAKELAHEVQGSLQEVGLQRVWALRPNQRDRMEWCEISAVELLPGDMFILVKADVMPVDALLLEGTAVTNEAVLTGESVPQSKMPLEGMDVNIPLDMMGRHRNSVLFAGTTVLYHFNEKHNQRKGIPKVPKNARKGVPCLALRTGSYSSRGDLMRALSKSRVGAISNPQTEEDAVKLILSLSVFAILACWSSLMNNTHHQTSTFRKLIQCTRIAIASIPSNIPMALSAIAQSCAAQLRKDSDVVCSEPGALLTAATIDAVVFDKTGTLTADTQSLSYIDVPPNNNNPDDNSDIDAILGGCHSLVSLDTTVERKLIGDPLDVASLRYSGWVFHHNESCYMKKSGNHTGTKLWQLKTFPFDPTRRTSSALVLILYQNKARLLQVMKGSPDKIAELVKLDNTTRDWYQTRNSQLGKEGMRTIALATKELSSSNVTHLFPDGLPSSNREVVSAISGARRRAQSLRRDDVENFGYEFAGFACFIASLRPSTKRIIEELCQAGIPVTMLTGDSIEAAISTSKAAGLIKTAATAVLDVDGKDFVWRIHENGGVQSLDVTRRTWLKLISNINTCSLATTGDAIELLESKSMSSADLLGIKSNLSRFSIIARASPKQKEIVISSMKDPGGKRVLMCGDGVNDVAAMKLADVSVALLNGYGDEHGSNESDDVEDERRKQKVSEKRIGSNRKVQQGSAKGGVGESRSATRARVKARIDAGLLDIKKRAAARQGISNLDSREIRFTRDDIRDQFAITMSAIKLERERTKLLLKGGAGAARILAEDERTRQNLNATNGDAELAENVDIKPGEASLASPFSCLRPAIDGVDGLIRVGVAASACALSTQQGIALSCLMAAYNLATLYREGFRYGRHMFSVEMMFYLAIDQAGYQAWCTPRPHLSTTRAPASLFHPSSIFSVIGQAFVHLMALTSGVKIANALESSETKGTPRLIRWRSHPSPNITKRRPLIEALAEALISVAPTEDKKDWFGRPKFRPNFATNVVFLFSVFQSGVTAVVNHKGKPFCGSFLESRKLSLAVCAAFLFSVVGIAETVPALNAMLELRPWPSRVFRYLILSLFLLDIVGCWLVNWLCTILSSSERHEITPMTRSSGKETAADLEARLLQEEEGMNRKLVTGMVVATVGLGLL